MSLIEQARELRGMVSGDGIVPAVVADDGTKAPIVDDPSASPVLEGDDADRIRQEWNAQPHHP